MKEQEFKALISLLEDEDPRIGDHVEQKLLSMGMEILSRLEQAWEIENNERVQTRIEDIIHVIQSQETVDKLIEWMEDPHPSLLEGWFLLTKFRYPELEFEISYNAIQRLVHKIWLEFTPGMNVPQRLKVINRMLYQRENYKANRSVPLDPKNYFLNGFLETKKGGPISLAILYLIIANELKLPIRGIPVPGHFILVCEDKRTRFFLDPINKGTFFTKQDLERYLKEVNADQDPEKYKPVTTKSVIKELAKTILICFKRDEKPDEVKIQQWESLLDELKSIDS